MSIDTPTLNESDLQDYAPEVRALIMKLNGKLNQVGSSGAGQNRITAYEDIQSVRADLIQAVGEGVALTDSGLLGQLLEQTTVDLERLNTTSSDSKPRKRSKTSGSHRTRWGISASGSHQLFPGKK